MEKTKKDTPGVIAPPPLIFLSGLIFGGIVQWFRPFYIFPPEYLFLARSAGVLLIVVGLGIILAAKIKMQKAKTNIEPWKPTNAIISDGIYSFSRNPIYAAMILIYLGFRFRPIYGLGAVIAMIHDVLVAFGVAVLMNNVFPWLNLEMNSTLLAAFLTLCSTGVAERASTRAVNSSTSPNVRVALPAAKTVT